MLARGEGYILATASAAGLLAQIGSAPYSVTKHAALTNTSDGIRWSFDLRYHPVGEPTGRPAFPGFVARSRQHPETAVTNWREWERVWLATRSRLAQVESAGKFTRWTSQEAICA